MVQDFPSASPSFSRWIVGVKGCRNVMLTEMGLVQYGNTSDTLEFRKAHGTKDCPLAGGAKMKIFLAGVPLENDAVVTVHIGCTPCEGAKFTGWDVGIEGTSRITCTLGPGGQLT